MTKLALGIFAIAILAAAVFHAGCRSTPRPHSVTLTWHAAVDTRDAKVVSYNIYRRTAEGPYVRVASGVRELAFKDELVNPGTTYYYVVRSVDQKGRESRASEEVSVTVPVP